MLTPFSMIVVIHFVNLKKLSIYSFQIIIVTSKFMFVNSATICPDL